MKSDEGAGMFLLHTMGYKLADTMADLTPAQSYFLISAAEYKRDLEEEQMLKVQNG